jgi:small subunit ribosomal protein S13
MPAEFRHIVRISGKDLTGTKSVYRALVDIKGVGITFARAVTYVAEVDPFKKLGDLTVEEVGRIEKVLKNPGEFGIPVWMVNRRRDYDAGGDMHVVGANIDISLRGDIGRERRIRSRRGIRHELGLPVRGQHTRTTGRKGLAIGVTRKELKAAAEAAKEGEKKEPVKKGGEKKAPEKKEGEKKEPVKKEGEKKEPVKKEGEKKEPVKKEGEKKAPEKKGGGKKG